MSQDRRSLFREGAIRRYMQRREKDVFPRLVSPPVFLCAWLLFGLLLLGGLVAWWAEIPAFVEGSGIVLTPEQTRRFPNAATSILIFLPQAYAAQIHTGLPVRVQVDADGPAILSRIERIEPGIIGPAAARQRYALDSEEEQAIDQPSVAILVQPRQKLASSMYAGSLVQAQVQVGSRRVLSLFPGLDGLMLIRG
ncbi:MAG TPA: hypothetical protein VKY19_12790 [Ktedonosporobacter sp.]|jgi:hypothetical protein|nr:hypothetical protein [Ktedonosporobacter sp.]